MVLTERDATKSQKGLSRLKMCQISGLVPPARDGVGDAVYKLHQIFQENGVASCTITSRDQQDGDEVFCDVSVWDFRALPLIVRRCLKEKVTVAVLHYPSIQFRRSASLVLLPLLLRFQGIATVLYLHEFATYSWIGKLRILLICSMCEQIITADAINYRLIRQYPLPGVRIHCIPTGASFIPGPGRQGCAIGSPRPKASLEPLILVHFGLIRSGKGIETIINTFRDDKELQRKYQLHLVGGLSEVHSKSDELLLDAIVQSPFVRYYGFVPPDAVSEILSVADLVVLPFEDGLTERRSSFMTAMAFGKPVLTSTPQISINGLVDRRNVLFLPGVDSGTLRDALLEIAVMPRDLLCQIGIAAGQWYMPRFSNGALFQKLSSVFGFDRSTNDQSAT